MFFKKRVKVLAVALFILVSFHLLSLYLGPRFVIQVNSGVYSFLKFRKLPEKVAPESLNLTIEPLNFTTHDGLKLRGGIVLTNDREQKGTIILLHGIRSFKEHFYKLSRVLSDNGYNSVILDLRAHGESEGEFCTFGYHEKKDIVHILDILERKSYLSQNIGIWGQSLGAAIAMQTMAVDQRIRYGIIESTFSDFRPTINDYMRKYTGIHLPVITNYMISRAEKIANFKAAELNPCEAAQRITVPVMVVHGSSDDRIGIECGRKNFNNLKSEVKQFVEIPGANHVNVWEKGGESYITTVLNFINQNLPKAASL